jgi:hypothetical protein
MPFVEPATSIPSPADDVKEPAAPAALFPVTAADVEVAVAKMPDVPVEKNPVSLSVTVLF